MNKLVLISLISLFVFEFANQSQDRIAQESKSEQFLMAVEDVFSITGRGTIVTGKIERGTLKVGEKIEIIGFDKKIQSEVTGIEMFRKLLDEGKAGDIVGILLKGVSRTKIKRGMVLTSPGNIEAHSDFEADISILAKNEGGRQTPFFTGFKPMVKLRTGEVVGRIQLPESINMVMPGDKVKVQISLATSIAMEKGQTFQIKEGGRLIGTGTISGIN